MDELGEFYLQKLIEFDYPNAKVMNDEEIVHLFSSESRMKLVSWFVGNKLGIHLPTFKDDYDVFNFFGEILAGCGICKKVDVSTFLKSTAEIDAQRIILGRMFYYLQVTLPRPTVKQQPIDDDEMLSVLDLIDLPQEKNHKHKEEESNVCENENDVQTLEQKIQKLEEEFKGFESNSIQTNVENQLETDDSASNVDMMKKNFQKIFESVDSLDNGLEGQLAYVIPDDIVKKLEDENEKLEAIISVFKDIPDKIPTIPLKDNSDLQQNVDHLKILLDIQK